MTNTEKVEIARDVNRVIKSRLSPSDDARAGIQVLGHDQFGNFRARSLNVREFDLTKNEEVPAEMVITKKGRTLIS